MSGAVLVYGAYGHTGRFVVAELQRRGWEPVAAGRDRDALAALEFLDVRIHPVTVDEPDELAAAVGDARAVLNCAGPFADTAAALITAALRAGVPYFDIAGEPDVVARTFERFGAAAEERGVVVMPAAGFFGTLGDLLASAAADDWRRADAITIAYALDEWKPTTGTRLAMQRMGGHRLVHRDGRLTVRTTPPPVVEWVFPTPIGRRSTIGEYPSPESVLIPQHIATPDVEVLMTVEALRDLRDPEAGPPVADDGETRSDQAFLVHAEAVCDGESRSAFAAGRDIYATTAPILVECMERTFDADDRRGGVFAPGACVDARRFLGRLARHDVHTAVASTPDANRPSDRSRA